MFCLGPGFRVLGFRFYGVQPSIMYRLGFRVYRVEGSRV